MTVAGIATIPERRSQLVNTIESLLYQVDKINISLNGDYWTLPYTHHKIEYALTDGTDEQKFRKVEGDLFLSCDDDLIYPPDYVATIKQGLKDYPGCIITFHGRNFHSFPVRSYYRDYSTKYRCLDRVEYDVYVQIGGSGCMAWLTKDFVIKPITHKFMSDICVSIQAALHGVPIVCLSHAEGWIKYQQVSETIYDRFKYNDTEQTNLINSIMW